MLFNSLSFAIFLPIVFSIYWLLPHKYRWILILASSYYFYMSWNAKYIVLILFTTCVSYGAARLLENEKNLKKKKMILGISAFLCLLVLFFFKYFNFVSESFTAFLEIFTIQLNPITLKLFLPVGISFYTFQTLSYVIDVYRGKIPAEKHFGYYAAFVSFFPQLVAGPIERAADLMPQIKEEHTFDYDNAAYGLKLMAWGLFKKMVIADTLSKYVSAVYDAPQKMAGFSLILATFFFSFQIYCDFSGYSDIAAGTSRLLGIHLSTNFKSPYFSQSIKEFWSRWHISLSTWFRDYVYIPLGGNRTGKVRHALNLLITFLASGLWHGANWTFVVWGGIHGAAQVVENIILPENRMKSRGIAAFFRTLFVFLFISFAWVFFVSNSIPDALYVIKHAFDGISAPGSYIYNGYAGIGMSLSSIIKENVFLVLLLVYDWMSLKSDVIADCGKLKTPIRWAIYVLLSVTILFLSQKGAAEFIYFQF
ncbi:MAG: MBOAT family protein [Lachnospiraceae bacterium]|nr:MBOAT family protein [Lachnospiraceae bacterium]